MHLHRTFMLAKLRPLKQGEAEIDGGRIERIKGVVEMVEIHADEILDMKRSGEADQVLRKIGEDAPVVRLVCVRLCRARNPTAEPHVVEFAAH